MRANLISLLVVLFCNAATANFSCHLTQQLGNPKVSSDAKFWEEFGEISERGSDRELAELLRKYEVDPRVSSRPVSLERRAAGAPASPAYQMSHTAKSELKSLQPALRDKADEFLQLAKGGSADLYAKLRANQGRWQLERLSGRQSDLQSVRLNQGYRVVFRERSDKSIEIVNFSKTATHGGH